MIKCLQTELGQVAQENNWLLVMMHKLRCVWSMYCDLKPNVFPSSPPYSLKDCSLTHSIGTYYFCWRANNAFLTLLLLLLNLAIKLKVSQFQISQNTVYPSAGQNCQYVIRNCQNFVVSHKKDLSISHFSNRSDKLH